MKMLFIRVIISSLVFIEEKAKPFKKEDSQGKRLRGQKSNNILKLGGGLKKIYKLERFST